MVTYACIACAVQAVEACLSWASWALDQGLITTSELHLAAPSGTKPTTPQSTSTEGHTTAPDQFSGLWLLETNTNCCHHSLIAGNEIYHLSAAGSVSCTLLLNWSSNKLLSVTSGLLMMQNLQRLRPYPV